MWLYTLPSLHPLSRPPCITHIKPERPLQQPCNFQQSRPKRVSMAVISMKGAVSPSVYQQRGKRHFVARPLSITSHLNKSSWLSPERPMPVHRSLPLLCFMKYQQPITRKPHVQPKWSPYHLFLTRLTFLEGLRPFSECPRENAARLRGLHAFFNGCAHFSEWSFTELVLPRRIKGPSEIHVIILDLCSTRRWEYCRTVPGRLRSAFVSATTLPRVNTLRGYRMTLRGRGPEVDAPLKYRRYLWEFPAVILGRQEMVGVFLPRLPHFGAVWIIRIIRNISILFE